MPRQTDRADGPPRTDTRDEEPATGKPTTMTQPRTRRGLLRAGAAVGIGAILAGCAGDGGEGTPADQTTESMAGGTRTTTAAETGATSSTTTAPATPAAPFETVTLGSFSGEVRLGTDPLVRVTLEGSLGSPGNHPRGGIIRTSPLEPPFEVTFAGVSFERESVQNGINLGISAFRSELFLQAGLTPYVSVRSEEGRSGPTEFVLEFGAEGSDLTRESEPFTVPGDDTDITLGYTGERIRALVDGTEVVTREYRLQESFFPAVTLEDDPDTEQGGSLTVASYAESDS